MLQRVVAIKMLDAVDPAQQATFCARPRSRPTSTAAARRWRGNGALRAGPSGITVFSAAHASAPIALTNEVIAPKHNKGRTVPMSPRIAEALAALPRRGLWVIAAEDGRSVDYDRAGGMLEAITGLYARVVLAKPAMPIHALRHTPSGP